MPSLVHYFPQQAEAVNAWLFANPRYANTDENAARIAAQVGPLLTAASLDAAWKQLQANPNPQQNPNGARALALALRTRIASCPIQGAKSQMLTALDAIVGIGGSWLQND